MATPKLSPGTPKEDTIDDKAMPLLDHLIELRTRLLWSMGAFLACFAVCYYFSRPKHPSEIMRMVFKPAKMPASAA